MWRIWAAALFWGLNWPVVKVLLSGAGPWTLRTAGLGGGFVLLALVTLASGRSLRVERAYWGRLFIAGLLNVAAFSLFAVFAQISMTASRAAILTYTMPLWSVVFARLMLGEPIDGLRWAALSLGAAGIALLSQPFWSELSAGAVPLALVYVLAAAISWAAGTVYLKRARIPGEPLAIAAWQMLTGAAAAGIGLGLLETPHLELYRTEILWNFIYHVVFPQAVAYVLWFSLMRQVSASTAALGTLLVPIFAVGGSMLAIGERPSVLDLTGFAIILAAVVLDQGVRGWRQASTGKAAT